MEPTIFLGGLPYAPDVNRLKDTYPISELREGRIIPHEELSAIIQSPARAGRYYAVCNAWVNSIKNSHGIILVWERKEGLKVLAPDGVLSFAETRTRQKLKQTGKALRLFSWVERKRLDATGQQRLDHQLRVASIIKASIDGAKKELACDLAPIKSLPKIVLPADSAKA